MRIQANRYFHDGGTVEARDGSDLTLVGREALAAVEREHGVELEPVVHRRNVTCEGVALDDLVEERFRVGGAVCVGTEPREPCPYLERRLGSRASGRR